ncbi:hypothetical protein WA026_014244 [Henosepilachna vigintioctopunctata]|uniref:Uncharacterized protein n=1 Tax=Henosepilachna vigintioctopunctata TaxID=420089 RepID=A0AAW1TTP6_9CUCU
MMTRKTNLAEANFNNQFCRSSYVNILDDITLISSTSDETDFPNYRNKQTSLDYMTYNIFNTVTIIKTDQINTGEKEVHRDLLSDNNENMNELEQDVSDI